MEVEPLTLCNREGVRYVRAQNVTQQIAAALDLSPAKLRASINVVVPESPQYLKEECLVHLIRYHVKHGNRFLVEDLAEALLRRIAKPAYRRLRAVGPAHVEDAYNEVVAKLFGRLMDQTTDKADFFEVKFWVGLKRLCIDVYAKYAKLHERDIEHEGVVQGYTAGEDGDAELRADQFWEALAAAQPDAPTRLLLDEALDLLPLNIRTAFVLRYYFGLQIESQDPAELTISRHLNVTGRTVQNWLHKSEQYLEKWRNGL